jgi:hypothetical protein
LYMPLPSTTRAPIIFTVSIHDNLLGLSHNMLFQLVSKFTSDPIT